MRTEPDAFTTEGTGSRQVIRDEVEYAGEKRRAMGITINARRVRASNNHRSLNQAGPAMRGNRENIL